MFKLQTLSFDAVTPVLAGILGGQVQAFPHLP
jgi:hypothetical protein